MHFAPCPVEAMSPAAKAAPVAARRSHGRNTVAWLDRSNRFIISERKHVLGRFYRLERSRNGPGNGLGLSLVAAVAKLHGARIAMADNSPGLKIELHFPLPEILNIAAISNRGHPRIGQLTYLSFGAQCQRGR
jgi:K+-sensing histidine kinase KdpD